MEEALHDLEEFFSQRPDTAHLRARKYGKSLIIYSGEKDDEQKHARLTSLGGEMWHLSFWHHSNRWDKTPFTGTVDELSSMLVEQFPAFLQHY